MLFLWDKYADSNIIQYDMPKNVLASYTNSKNTQNQDVYCVVQKKNYAYLFIAFIFYYRLEQIDAFVMKSEVVIIY